MNSNISRMVFNDLKNQLRIVFTDGEEKNIDLTREQFDELVKCDRLEDFLKDEE